MQPTENYLLFELAERLGKTVGELLKGRADPLSSLEFQLWKRFYTARARVNQQSRQSHKPGGR